MMMGQKIAEGNTAEVFAWGEKEVLKLFRDKFPVEAIKREYEFSKEVERLELSVPKVGEIINVGGRTGIIYERITGASLLKHLTERPWLAGGYGKKMADLHYRIHQCKAQNIWKLKDVMSWNINHTEYLSEEKKQELLKYLERQPEGEILCHGDLHPGNIIEVKGKPVILDWMTATIGNPATDVARTLLLINGAVLPEKVSTFKIRLVNLLRKTLTSSYIKRYLSLSDITLQEIEQWRVLVAAARLTEWVAEEEKLSLLNIVHNTVIG